MMLFALRAGRPGPYLTRGPDDAFRVAGRETRPLPDARAGWCFSRCGPGDPAPTWCAGWMMLFALRAGRPGPYLTRGPD